MDKEKLPENGERFAAYIGIDWADQKHDVHLLDSVTGKGESEVVGHTPEALSEWMNGLRARYRGSKIAVCLEQSRGALIYALMGHDFLVLYPINPVTLAKYREAFAPSRAKDDPRDAQLLCELVTQHRNKLKPWKPDDENTRSLALLNEERRKTVDLRTRLLLRLQSTLKNYFPQAMEIVGEDISSPMACDFLLKWPELDTLKRAKPQTIRSFYYGHNCRNAKEIEQRIEQIREAKPLTTDSAVINSSVITVKMLARQLRSLNDSIKEYDRQIATLFVSHPDSSIFDSFPGAGDALAPRLLSAFGTDRNRFSGATDVQNFTGISPVIERSGKQSWTHWRWNCPKFIRQTFHEFAAHSIPFSVWAKAYYQMQRECGKSHHAAIRALAFKWIRIMFRCWKDRKPYDEAAYLETLKKRGSRLWKYIEQMQAQVA